MGKGQRKANIQRERGEGSGYERVGKGSWAGIEVPSR